MNSRTAFRLAAAAGLLGLWACSESTSPASPIDQTTLTTDVASSSGDAIAVDVSTMAGNETTASLASASVAGAPASEAGVAGKDSIVYVRSRTCFDSTATTVSCVPLSAVRKIVTHVSLFDVRTDTAENGAVFSGDLTRVADDTLFRIFTGTSETSRTHDGVASGSDTSSFVGPNVTRTYDEAGTDSVEAVTWNLPRSSNQWPASGEIVRNVAVHATFTSATKSQTTDVTKRVEVDFNGTETVNLLIDGKTCTLDLKTRRVSNCQ